MTLLRRPCVYGSYDMPGGEHPVHDGAAECRHHAKADEDDGRHQLEHTERDVHVRDKPHCGVNVYRGPGLLYGL